MLMSVDTFMAAVSMMLTNMTVFITVMLVLIWILDDDSGVAYSKLD